MFSFDARTKALLAAVGRLGTVSAAARSLGMDPSNAHRHLRAAERHAGARLVTRSRGGRGGGAARLDRSARALLDSGKVGPGFVAAAGDFDEEEGATPLRVGRRVLHAAGRVPQGLVEAWCRPEDVALSRPAPGSGVTSARNALPARVESLAMAGEGTWTVRLAVGTLRLDALVTRGAIRDLRLREGSRVVATVKATAVRWRALGE